MTRWAYSSAEVAARLGKSDEQVRRWCAGGTIAGAFKLGKLWFVPGVVAGGSRAL